MLKFDSTHCVLVQTLRVRCDVMRGRGSFHADELEFGALQLLLCDVHRLLDLLAQELRVDILGQSLLLQKLQTPHTPRFTHVLHIVQKYKRQPHHLLLQKFDLLCSKNVIQICKFLSQSILERNRIIFIILYNRRVLKGLFFHYNYS